MEVAVEEEASGCIWRRRRKRRRRQPQKRKQSATWEGTPSVTS
jgi:hypothetical protein